MGDEISVKYTKTSGGEVLTPWAPGVSDALAQQAATFTLNYAGTAQERFYAQGEAEHKAQMNRFYAFYSGQQPSPSFYGRGLADMLRAPSVLGEGVGKEPASEVGEIAALPYPTPKPHDFSNPYLTVRLTRLDGGHVLDRACVNCGSVLGTCTPIPGWREDRERELVQVQNAQEAGRALECQTPLFHPQSISTYVKDERLLRKGPW